MCDRGADDSCGQTGLDEIYELCSCGYPRRGDIKSRIKEEVKYKRDLSTKELRMELCSTFSW